MKACYPVAALALGLGPALLACGATGKPENAAKPSGADASTSGGGPGSGGVPATSGGGSGGHAATVVDGSMAGSGGAAGAMTSSGGFAGASGDAGAADAGVRPPDGAPPDGAPSASYVCSLILGIATTSEWFGGFEKVVDSARWELKSQDSAHIEKWADPANAVWALPITSPCAEHADAPDRIVFMGTNYDYDTVDLFLPKYVAVLNNIRAKYPTVRRLDVMTYTRGPGNKECVGADRSGDSYIKPAQDDAIAEFARMYSGVVFPAPKWEVASCSDFTLCPHLTGSANAVISKTIGAYFLMH